MWLASAPWAVTQPHGLAARPVLLLVVSRVSNRCPIKLAVVVSIASIVKLLSGELELSVDRRRSVGEREVVRRRSGE